MTANKAPDDSRVRDMTENLQRGIDADPSEEGGIRPVGLEYLEEFLQDLTVNILDRNEVGCPLVQPGEDGDIVLVWRNGAGALHVDVRLPSRKAEHVTVDKDFRTETGKHTLKSEGWSTLSEKVSEWKKSTTTQ